jgi:two-component system nitrate/nitrite response regulator NarL
MESPMGSEPNTIRILIADEQQTCRDSLRTILESGVGLQIIGEAFDARSAADLTARLRPDVLVLDFALSRELRANGVHLTDRYLAGVRILMMLGSPETSQVVEALQSGAKGVVPKASTPAVWFKSIRRIVAGQYFLGNENVEVLVRALQEVLPKRAAITSPSYYGLTPRELEIVQRIARGCSNKAVGLEFSIRERTVKHHLTNIFSKVGVSSRLELALFARDNHLLQGAPISSDDPATK